MTALTTQAPAAGGLATVSLTGAEASLFAAVVDHHMGLVEGGREAWPREVAGPAPHRQTVDGAFIHGDLPIRAEAGLVLRCTRAPGRANGWLSQIDVETDGGRRFACEILCGFVTEAGGVVPADLFGASDAARTRHMRDVAAGDRFVPRPEAALRRRIGDAIRATPGAGARFVALEAAMREHEADVADLRGVGLRPVRRRIQASARLDAEGDPTISSWLRSASPESLSVRVFSLVTAEGHAVPLASCETLYAL